MVKFCSTLKTIQVSIYVCIQFEENQDLLNFLVDYVDIDYSLWLTRCLTPLLVTFLLPLVIGLLLYLSAFMLYIYKLHWGRLRSALIAADKWETARKFVAIIWDAHGWIWHGKKHVNNFIRLMLICTLKCN